MRLYYYCFVSDLAWIRQRRGLCTLFAVTSRAKCIVEHIKTSNTAQPVVVRDIIAISVIIMTYSKYLACAMQGWRKKNVWFLRVCSPSPWASPSSSVAAAARQFTGLIHKRLRHLSNNFGWITYSWMGVMLCSLFFSVNAWHWLPLLSLSHFQMKKCFQMPALH